MKRILFNLTVSTITVVIAILLDIYPASKIYAKQYVCEVSIKESTHQLKLMKNRPILESLEQGEIDVLIKFQYEWCSKNQNK